MKLKSVISDLVALEKAYGGEVEVNLVNTHQKEMTDEFPYIINDNFFIVDEKQNDGTVEIQMRTWPY
jgi:hypothetical protein